MIEIEYCSTGTPVNDFNLDVEYRYILSCIEDGRFDILYYSTENIFTRVRYGVVSGEINPESVCFVYENERLTLNEYGKLSRWPENFCNVCINLSEKILRTAMDKYKKKKEQVIA